MPGAVAPKARAQAPSIGGNCTTRGSDTPATRQRRASCSAKPPTATGMEGAGGTAGPGRTTSRRAEHTPAHPAPQVWRAPEGPEGTGGLRGAAPNEVRSPSLAGGRGLRRLEHPWSHEQHASSCWAAAHRHTQRPGPARRTLRYAERLGPAVRTAAAASSVGGGQIQGFDGRLEGGGCLLVLV